METKRMEGRLNYAKVVMAVLCLSLSIASVAGYVHFRRGHNSYLTELYFNRLNPRSVRNSGFALLPASLVGLDFSALLVASIFGDVRLIAAIVLVVTVVIVYAAMLLPVPHFLKPEWVLERENS